MHRKPELRLQFWIETALAAVAGILTVVTALWHEWIEIVFGVDPDGGSGLLEWGIVVALAAAGVLFGLLAGAEWRHAAAGPAR